MLWEHDGLAQVGDLHRELLCLNKVPIVMLGCSALPILSDTAGAENITFADG